MSKALSIELAQINPVMGDLKGNTEKILDLWQNTESDLIVFPETVICGYPPEDLILKPAFLSSVHEHVENLVTESRNIQSAALITSPWIEDGKTYNAFHFVHRGERITQYKHHLPNYGVFDERRVFDSGAKSIPVSFQNWSLGFMICEDFWYPDIAGNLKEKGAEILITTNGSPYDIEKKNIRKQLAKQRVQESGLPFLFVNQVGGQDELVFDGQSFALNQEGEDIINLAAFEEDKGILHIERNEDTYSITADRDSLKALSKEEELYSALMLGIKDYVGKNDFPGVIIGLSGGIDSALTAALAVDALGADRIKCYMMPSRYTSQESLQDAEACAKMLGVSLESLEIDSACKALESTILEALPENTNSITFENLQSRIRGLMLMALSNAHGHMVLTTGNKSEMAAGYATLYGDMNGGFNALKDVYKTQVYKLSQWRNTHKPSWALGPDAGVMPERIITKAPSAELKDNQTDQDSLPTYDALDNILECLIEQDMSIEDIISHGHDRETVIKIWAMLDRAEYKRRQAAPGVKVTSRAFGRDRRYPITNKFLETLEK